MKLHLGECVTSWQEALGNPTKDAGICLLGMWVCGPGEAKGLGEIPSQIHFLIWFWKVLRFGDSPQWPGVKTPAAWRVATFCNIRMGHH